MKITVDRRLLAERLQALDDATDPTGLITPSDLPLDCDELEWLSETFAALDASIMSLSSQRDEQLLDFGVEIIDTEDEATSLVVTAAIVTPGPIVAHYVPQAHVIDLRLTDFWALGDAEGFAPVATALTDLEQDPESAEARRLVTEAITDQRTSLCAHLVTALNHAIAADQSFWCRHLDVPDTGRIAELDEQITLMEAVLDRRLADGRYPADDIAYRIDLARAELDDLRRRGTDR